MNRSTGYGLSGSNSTHKYHPYRGQHSDKGYGGERNISRESGSEN